VRDLSFRTIMGWLFALEAALFLPTGLWESVHQSRAHLGPASHGTLTLVFFSLSIIVFASASLTVLKKWRTAQVWGVAASFLLVLFYFMQLGTPDRFVWWHDLADLFLGLLGMIAFMCISSAKTAANKRP